MEEIWKPIRGFSGVYEVSNLGRVKSNHKRMSYNKGILRQYKSKKGYMSIVLDPRGKCKFMYTHRLVAQHFILNSKKRKEVNHIDNNPSNNNVLNLEWLTKKQNIKYSIKQNRNVKGEQVKTHKLKKEDIKYIRSCGKDAEKLAYIFNVSKKHIIQIIKGKTWKHLL